MTETKSPKKQIEQLKQEISRLNQEIDQHKQVKLALEESERKLSTLMNNLPGMVYRCKGDEHYTIEFASNGSAELLGCEPGELIGSKITNTFRKLVFAEDRPKNLQLIDEAIKKKQSFELFYRLKTTSGKEKWVWDQGEGVFSSEGKLLALEGFITDVSTYKMIEAELREENDRLKSSKSERYKFGQIVGKSRSMQQVYDLIIKAAGSSANVIVYGESGTGKELVARAIHDLSERRDNAFVPVNCGAIPKDLMESEFFGHTKGAFSGAYHSKSGYLDIANGGTLFLDELGEISLDMQVKLLRILDGMGFMPVGSNQTKTTDVRIIAATNRDLKTLIRNGSIREDFYYRVHILPISLPSLRERKEDVPLLVDHFVQLHHTIDDSLDIPSNLLIALKNHTFPGNVRELRNIIDRFITLGETDFTEQITQEHPELLNLQQEHFENSTDLKLALNQFEKKFILRMLNRFKWKKGRTAERMGITPRTLQRKLKQHQIKS